MDSRGLHPHTLPVELARQSSTLPPTVRGLVTLLFSRKGAERHWKRNLKEKQVRHVSGNKEQADIFILAAYGLLADRPSSKVLRRRLQVLSERFVQNPCDTIAIG
jgi:hypothetical protein